MDVTQVLITAAGGPDRLATRSTRLDPPGPGEVQVEVQAAGINFADILARQGLYPDAPPLPCVVGYEVSGTVTAVAEDVDDSLVGAEVLALTRFGGYSSGLNVPAAQVFAKPASLSHPEAASIPVAYATAWSSPRSRRNSCLPGLAVPIVRAPRWRATSMAASPTPEPAFWTRTVSPARRPPWTTSSCQAVA